MLGFRSFARRAERRTFTTWPRSRRRRHRSPILRRLHARYANRADDLIIVQQGQAAFNRHRARQNEHRQAAIRNHLIEDFGRPFEQERAARLFLGDGSGADWRLVEPLQKEKMAAIVKHGDRHFPIVLQRLGLRGGGDVLGIGEGEGEFLCTSAEVSLGASW